MRERRFFGVLAGTLLAWGGLSLAGTGAERCSMMMTYGPHLMESRQYIFATATEASVAAPSAVAALAVRPAPRFDADSVAVLGQVVELHGARAADEARVRELLEGHDRAVVVWWAYDTACRPFIADPGEGFAEPGLGNVIAGVLTDPDYWIDGMPLVQVFQTLQTPMPGVRMQGLERQAARTGAPPRDVHEVALTGAELWALVSGLPFSGDAGMRWNEPLDPETEAIVLEWAEAHPDRWMLPPAYEQVVRARATRQGRLAPLRGPPVGGLYRGTLQLGELEGEFCFSLFESPLPGAFSSQELPVDYDTYAAAPWEEAPPAARGYRVMAAPGCGPDELVVEDPTGQPAWSPLRNSLWLRTDREIEPAPGELRAWSAALLPRGFQIALAESEPELPSGLNPLGRVQYQPGVAALPEPPSAEALAEVVEMRTTARVALLDDGSVRIADERGAAPITFSLRAHRILEP